MKQTKFISEDEKQTIRAARKVLEKLVKRYTRLREKSGYASSESEEKHYKMFKELMRLKVDVGINNSENGNEEIIQLSLNSGMYETEIKKLQEANFKTIKNKTINKNIKKFIKEKDDNSVFHQNRCDYSDEDHYFGYACWKAAGN